MSNTSEDDGSAVPETFPLLSFHLDKTYAALFEADKRLSAAFNLLSVITVTLLVCLFGNEPKEGWSVPIIGLKLNKWHATELLSIIHAACFYRFTALNSASKLIGHKFRDILDQYGDTKRPWHIFYPSVHMFNVSIHKAHKQTEMVFNVVALLIFITGFFLPLFCLIWSVMLTSITASWCISFFTCLVILIAAGLSLILAIDYDDYQKIRPHLEEWDPSA